MNTRAILPSTIFSILGLFFGALIPFSSVSAATATSTQELPVANVYIHNATIVAHTNNSFTVFFSIGNGTGAQPDVKYGVELFKAGPHGSQVLADQYIANETLSLSSNQPIMGHTITYTAPAFFSGAYQVWVTAESSSGFPYSAVPAGTVTFIPSVQGFVEINTSTCFLSASGDTTHTQYTPQQGVDILPNESLTATCQVTNHFPKQEIVWPQIETRYRSMYGAIVPVPAVTATTTLAANKTQEIAFAIPVPQTPQAYDAAVRFTDASGAVVSNNAVFHYVVAGPSATIQNATLDRNIYKPGDTALAAIYWTPSADSFPGSRYGTTTVSQFFLSETLSAGSSGLLCAASQTIELNVTPYQFSIPITASCSNPTLLVILKDANGTVLDQKVFTVTSPVTAYPYRTLATAIAIIGGVIALYGAIQAISRKKHYPLV